MFKVITVPENALAACTVYGESPSDVMVVMTSVRFSTTQDVVLSFSLDVPTETPDPNVFQVTVKTASNSTADSNTQIPGMKIPPKRLQSKIRWMVQDFESLSWLQAWADAALDSGAVAQGLSQTLAVSNTSVSVYSAVAIASDNAHSRRLASAPDGHLEVDFSIALRLDPLEPDSYEQLYPKFMENDFPTHMTSNMLAAVTDLGLFPISLQDCVVAELSLVLPPNATEPSLYWASSIAETVTEVTLGLVFNNYTEDIQAILLVLPPTFNHKLRTLADFRVLRQGGLDDLPVAQEEGSWIDTRSSDMIRIHIAESARINAGGYAFQLPVFIPYEVPPENIWFLCLCTSRACNSPTHSSVVTAFALPGFNIGERHPHTIVVSATMKRSCFTDGIVVLGIVWLYLVTSAGG